MSFGNTAESVFPRAALYRKSVKKSDANPPSDFFVIKLSASETWTKFRVNYGSGLLSLSRSLSCGCGRAIVFVAGGGGGGRGVGDGCGGDFVREWSGVVLWWC